MAQRTFVIVGASLAGATAAAQLREDGFEGRIVLLGEEPSLPYERPGLSKSYLAGGSERTALDVHPAEFYADRSIEVRTSSRVRSLERRNSAVVLDDGSRIRFDRLLLATGSVPRRLDLPGADLQGIHYLRTVEDANALRAAARGAHRVLVIGAGWLGAEVAATLRQTGLPVVLIATERAPLERVLGPMVANVFRGLHEDHGVELCMHTTVRAFRGSSTVEALELMDGTRIDGDLVVVGVGARPRVELAVEAGLDVGDGILVDEHLETSSKGIFAAGDVAGAWHPLLRERMRVEHWDNARRQGRAAARSMLGAREPYLRIPYFFSEQYDLGVEYAGYARTFEQVVFRGDPSSSSFLAFWLAGGRVVAGMNANVWVNDQIAALVASRRPVDAARLSDPSVPLGELAVPAVPSTPRPLPSRAGRARTQDVLIDA